MTLTPNTETRVGRMLDGLLKSKNRNGKVLLTVAVKDADGGSKMHETISLKKWTGRNDVSFLFVALPNTANWDAGIRPATPLKLNLSTGELTADTSDARVTPLVAWAARKAFEYAQSGEYAQPGNGSLEIHEESACGVCGLPLTDDTSIKLGIGPDCEKRLYGKTTSRSKTISSSSAPAAAPAAPLSLQAEADAEMQAEGEMIAAEEAAAEAASGGGFLSTLAAQIESAA